MTKPARRIFTPAELDRMTGLRSNGTTWKTLAKMFQCDSDTIRRVIDPGFTEKRSHQVRMNRARLRAGGMTDWQFMRSAAEARAFVVSRICAAKVSA